MKRKRVRKKKSLCFYHDAFFLSFAEEKKLPTNIKYTLRLGSLGGASAIHKRKKKL